MSREQHDLIDVTAGSLLVNTAETHRTSSSSALSSPSVGPFEPRAAGSRLIIPSTSFTILTAASTDAGPAEELPRAESDVGPPSPAVGPAAGGVAAPSVSVLAVSAHRLWESVTSGTLCSTYGGDTQEKHRGKLYCCRNG